MIAGSLKSRRISLQPILNSLLCYTDFMKDFTFVTGNKHKVVWLQKFLGVNQVNHRKLDIGELQSPIPEEVIEHKVRLAYQKLNKPVLVDDVSLVFEAWGDMPGTFIKFFVDGPGLEATCRMLDGFNNRSAFMRVSYGYFDGQQLKIFTCVSKGSIARHPGSNKTGHGFDPIFIRDGEDLPHSELSEQTYKMNHPRGKAVHKLKQFLEAN